MLPTAVKPVALTALLLTFLAPSTAFSIQGYDGGGSFALHSPALSRMDRIVRRGQGRLEMTLSDDSSTDANIQNTALSSRRRFLLASAALASYVSPTSVWAPPANAEEEKKPAGKPLDSCLYTILRVREATEQESRLIKSGKFKDVQRANIKLAVRYIVNNYRLADNFIAAAAYLDGNTKRIQAGDLGQMAVQNLYTILEYFDSADVQNLKVGSDSVAGKEPLILKGLEAARQNIDDFISYFPPDVVDGVKAKIAEENELNEKEFDTSIGAILNPNPKR